MSSGRWTVLLVWLAVVAFGGAVAAFVVPVGVVSDSECGLPIQAFLRHEFNQVCNPEGRARLRLIAVFAFAIVTHLLHGLYNVGNLLIYAAATWVIAASKS